jgi:hypothetical protein
MMKQVLRERVDYLLKERKIRTLSELHARIQEKQPGFAWQTLSLIVNGKRWPRLDTLDAIAQGLETTIAYLIGEINDPAPQPCAGEPLPEVRSWSDRLKALSAGQRVALTQAMEIMLGALEAKNAAPQ